MKTRESGMPEEQLWSTFFSPKEVLVRLGLTGDCREVVDFGCGYGTFTIPVARIVTGTVLAFDIDRIRSPCGMVSKYCDRSAST